MLKLESRWMLTYCRSNGGMCHGEVIRCADPGGRSLGASKHAAAHEDAVLWTTIWYLGLL